MTTSINVPAEPDTRTYRVEFPALPDRQPLDLTTTPDRLAGDIHAAIDPGGNWDFEVEIAASGLTARVVNYDDSDSGYGTLTITEVTAPADPDVRGARQAVVDAAQVWRWSGDTADGHRRAEQALMAAVDALNANPAQPDSTPTPGLLAAVRAVIDAGRPEWDGGVDVDRLQHEAHARLVAAYEAATGTRADVEPNGRQRLAAELHRLVDDIVRLELPLPQNYMHLGGVLPTRDAVEQWADHLGVAVTMGGMGGIPVAKTEIPIGDGVADLTVAFQGPEELTELERLRADNARLAAALEATQGGAR